MRRSRISRLLLLPLLLLLAACTQTSPEQAAFGPKRIAITPQFHELEVYFPAGAAEPTAEERMRFLARLRAIGLERGDELVIPGQDGLARARADALYRLAASAQGAPVQRAAARPTTARSLTADAGAARGEEVVRALVIRRQVRVPNCPDWSRGGMQDWRNLPTSNFGCATAVNLREMVADPRDLVVGRGSESYDGERAAIAIQRYREWPQEREEVESAFGVLE